VVIPEHSDVFTGSTFTYEAWIKPANIAGIHMFISKYDPLSGADFYSYIYKDEWDPQSAPFFVFQLFTDMDGNAVSHLLPLDFFDNWHHIAVTYNGSFLQLYIDTDLVHSIPFTGSLIANTGRNVVLGNYENTFPYLGLMDEVRIWNVARSQADLQQFWKTDLPANAPGLVAHYNFDQGTVNGNNTAITTLTDRTSRANHGMLQNFNLMGSTSNFTDGSPDLVTLPLHLTRFTALEKPEGVLLGWQTAQKDIVTFTVERSADGRKFQSIGTVPFTGEGTQYTFIDRSPLPGTNYYRLRSLELNDKTDFSRTLVVQRSAATGIRLFPNPATTVLQVQVSGIPVRTAFIRNVAGAIVRQVALPGSALQTVQLSVEDLAPGTYYLQAGTQSAAFIKQ
ncbi:MAG TPA: LamG-like jellyroll fold domain-containing protein, partial [Chitinophagaceae bacterium]|nr:LamG-like jellyroll fold domain-containing protein [Chitinophagaceae bacterium]